jgi:hypothetical protein
MFEALMPVLALDERSWAPRSLGRNGAVHAEVQRRHALETLGYPIWGMSPSAQPNAIDYGEFGVPILGTAGYRPGVVTPHASALALAVTPAEATANLRRIAERYDAYGEYGFYDAIDPETSAVAHAYLSLDQSMSFVALVNHLKDGAIQRRFAADPAVAPAHSSTSKRSSPAACERCAISRSRSRMAKCSYWSVLPAAVRAPCCARSRVSRT